MSVSETLPDRVDSRLERDAAWLRSDRRAALLLALLFALSRAAASLAGLRFDAVSLAKYWQILDPVLLRGALLESLVYLHSQPPLFNLFLGLVLKLAPGWEVQAFALGYQLLGLVLGLALFALLRFSGLPRLVAVGLAALFVCSPPSLLYENYLFYTYPVTVGLVLAAVFFHRYVSEWRAGDGWAAFALLAGVCLTRSVFHVTWLVAVSLLLVAALHGAASESRPSAKARARRLAPAAAALLLVVTWYAKNWLLFGTFAASSWLGMNLASLTVGPLYPEERVALIEAGELSPLADILPFSPLPAYRGQINPVEATGIAVLDRPHKANGKPNFNHLQYVGISEQYGRDAFSLLRARPLLYAKSVLVSLRIYLRPANEYRFLDRNRQAIAAWDSAFAMLHYGSPGLREDYPERISGHPVAWYLARLSRASPAVVALTVLALGYGFWALLTAGRSRSLDATTATVAFMWGTLVWITLVGTLLEVGENNRFRYLGEPFVLVLSAAAIRSFAQAWTSASERAAD